MSLTVTSSIFSLMVLLSSMEVQGQNSLGYTKPVNTQSGQIRGVKGQKVDKYLGIPYAEAERFKRPHPPPSWYDIKDTVAFGSKCYALQNVFRYPESDDCLNLNVYVPTSRKSLIPVMVWIHSGLFYQGSGRDQDGSRLAAEGNVIVVTFNHRLGIFGFFGHQGVKNAGLLDQLEALKWVQNNIGNFGGDVNRVTLMGSSAGSISASLLSLSPLADNLFNNVILMSGFVNPFFTTWTNKLMTSVWTKKTIDMFINFNRKNKCACSYLCEFCAPTVAQKWKNLQTNIYLEEKRWFFPMIDKFIIPDDPESLLENKTFKKRNILIGFNKQDGSVFTNLQNKLNNYDYTDPLQIDIDQIKAKEQFSKGLRQVWDVSKNSRPYIKYFDKIANFYNKNPNALSFIDMFTDVMYKYPALKMANAFSEKNANVYLYQFEHRQKLNNQTLEELYGSTFNSYHATEGPFVFGSVLNSNKSSPHDLFVSREVMKMWTNFAKLGRPTEDNVWFSYKEKYPAHMIIGRCKRLVKTHGDIMDKNLYKQLDKIFAELKGAQRKQEEEEQKLREQLEEWEDK